MALSVLSDASSETIALLEAVLASGDGETAGAAARALARALGTAAVPTLVRAAEGGSGPAVQQACVAALGDIGGKEVPRALAALLERGGPSWPAQRRWRWPRSAIGTRCGSSSLLPRGGSAGRRAALAALGQSSGPEVEALMLELAESGPPAEPGASRSVLHAAPGVGGAHGR